jgi:hypothetical protein
MHCLQVRFAQLSDACTRHFVVLVPKAIMTVQVDNYYIFGGLSVFPRPPKVLNVITNQRMLLVNCDLLPPWTTMQLQHLVIAAGTCSVTQIIAHTHEYVFMDTAQCTQQAPKYI